MRRPRSDDEEWFLEEKLLGDFGVGSATTISEVPNKRKRKIYRRRIGFLVDIDELIEAD